MGLKRSGRSYKGLCPFHGEKTPSFYVFPETGTWKCFGCGEGGDVFTFLQRRENLEFGEALRLLAHKAGVEIRAREALAPEAEAAEARLRGALASAEMYFRAALRGSSGARARVYLEARAITEQAIELFGLGYAPSSGLLRHLREAGISDQEAREVGLSGARDDGSQYELFRERVIFPIRDPNGRTIAFGARTMGEAQPKYLNSPQTRFFDKSGSLFAFDLARAAIRQSGQAVIVEGYFDAITAHQAGYTNVVATLGTSLTERHFDLLGRRAAEIVLALDADAAGQAAMLRGQKLADHALADAVVPIPAPPGRDRVVQALGREAFYQSDSRAQSWVRFQAVHRSQIKIAELPDGLDPDDLVREDPERWGRLVVGAMPVVDFLLSRLGGRYDLATAIGKRDAVQEAIGVIRDLTDPVEREHYLQRLAAIVGLDESGLRAALGRLGRRPLQPLAPQEDQASRDLPEAYALALLFLAGPQPDLLSADDISTPEGRAIFASISCMPRTAGRASISAFATSPRWRS